jgi:hypothetical protein
LTANALLNDKDFVSFMSTVEELRYVSVRKVANSRTLPNLEFSLKRIETLSQNINTANKELIIKELGFRDYEEYNQLQEALDKKRVLLLHKFPSLSSMDGQKLKSLSSELISKTKTFANTRTSGSDICIDCFMNNCEQCYWGNGYAKAVPGSDGAGGDQECDKWRQACKQKRQGALDQAKGELLAEALGCLAAGYQIGTNVAAGSVPFIGPFAGHAGAAAGILSGFGCGAWATYIYLAKESQIEADYTMCTMDGPCAK